MTAGTKAVPNHVLGMAKSPLQEADSSTDASDKDASVECPTCGRTDFKSEQGVKQHHGKVHGESLSQTTVSCDGCGENMTVQKNRAERYDSHYCSEECQHSSYKHRETVECSWCGDSIERAPSQLKGKENVFCDNDCLGEWRAEYTSGDQSWHWKGGSREVECEMCGSLFEVPPGRVSEARFCSGTCHGDWVSETYNGEDHPNWKGGGSINYGRNWPEQRQKALSRDGNKCVVCAVTNEKHKEEYGRSLHVHHVKPFRTFIEGDVINYESANELNNLVTLCYSCHNRWEGIPLKPQVVDSVS